MNNANIFVSSHNNGNDVYGPGGFYGGTGGGVGMGVRNNLSIEVKIIFNFPNNYAFSFTRLLAFNSTWKENIIFFFFS